MKQKEFILLEFAKGKETSHEKVIQDLMVRYSLNRKQAMKNIRRYSTQEERIATWGPLSSNTKNTENNKKIVGFIDIDPAYIFHDKETKIYHTYLSVGDREHAAVSEEDVQEAFQMYSNWKQTGRASTINEVCRRFGWSRAWFIEFKHRMGMTHDQDPFTPEQHIEMTTESKINSLVMMNRGALERANNAAQLKQIEEDADKWRNFNFKTLKPMRSLVEESLVARYIKSWEKVAASDEEKFIVFAPQDLHVGKIGWNGEGSLEETRRLLLGTTKDLIEQAKNSLRGNVPKVILVLGSDWWNSDNCQGATTNGTPQDNSVPPEVALKFGMHLQNEMIDLLRELGPVRIFVVPGNHDRYSCHAAQCFLSAIYRNCEDVIVEDNTDNYQFHLEGRNLLGFHHGDGIKGGRNVRPERHHIKMSHSVPELWGASDHRTQFGGHLHGFDIKDEAGVRYIQTPSLSLDDRWHEQKNFVGRIRAQNAFLFDNLKGLSQIFMSDARYCV